MTAKTNKEVKEILNCETAEELLTWIVDNEVTPKLLTTKSTEIKNKLQAFISKASELIYFDEDDNIDD